TNKVNTANDQASTTSTPVSTASTQDNTTNLSDATIYAFLANQPNGTGKKITINGSDTASYDKSKIECFNCHKMGYFAWECRGPRNQYNRNKNQDSSRRTINVKETSSKAMVAIDGAGYEPKTNKSVSEDTSNEVRESPDASFVEELVLNDKLEKKIVFPIVAKLNFVRPQQQEKPVRKPVKYAEMYRS
ncbi:ribonuclease H-like domain-containing protein, partial [Tanacetum coccineum]